MAIPLVNGAMCACTFGAAPSPLFAAGQQRALAANLPMATVSDLTLATFGMCSSPGNPVVAGATAAALGVLTPMPCVPAPAGAWTPGSPAVLVGGKPAVNNACKLMCAYGGVISAVMSPAATVNLP